MSGQSLGLDLGLKESFRSGLASLNCSEGSFQPFGELLTRLSLYALDTLLHSTVWANGEANRSLRHPETC